MLRWDDDELAGTIFHELAHQRLFVKGDTEFNESFATFVQYEGLRQWHAARGLASGDNAGRIQEDQFEQLVLDTRERLRLLYATALAPDAMRARKRDEIERLRAEYARVRDTQREGKGGYDEWINAPINNAKLLPFGLYRRWVPAFSAVFAQQGSDWAAFYAAVAKIARLDAAARAEALTALQDAKP